MDPLTHTLVGANLASTRLGEKSRLAVAALVIGANAPDVDVFAYFLGSDFGTGFRRGWTHGILAMAVLPFALTGLLWLWARIRPRTKEGPPLSLGWLLLLSTIAILSHPFLDWLNNYGIRLLMPFNGRWFYGDSVFIMDPWFWLLLGVPFLLGRKPTRGLVITWAVFTGLIGWVVAGRAGDDLIIVLIISASFLLALLHRPRNLHDQHRFGRWGLALGAAWVCGMLALHAVTVHQVRKALVRAGVAPISRLMVGPVAIDVLKWDVVAQTEGQLRWGTWSWRFRRLDLAPGSLEALSPDSPFRAAAEKDPQVDGFMCWVRFPWIETEETPAGLAVHILDARYTRQAQTGFGGATMLLPRTAQLPAE